jgi:nitrate reductase delta subunit
VSDYDNAVKEWLTGREPSEGGGMPEAFRIPTFARKRPEHTAALDRVRAWTRERFKLAEDATVMVAEIACGLPGCPPLETVVAFWTEGDTRHQFKVFKRVAEVVEDDLPPAWLKNGLIVNEDDGFTCC